MTCAQCGSDLPHAASYCPICGQATTHAAIGPTQRLLPVPRGGLQTGRCPVCGDDAIFYDGQTESYQRYHTHRVAISTWLSALITTYVCTTCGYLESYLAEEEDRADIQHHWTAIRPGNP